MTIAAKLGKMPDLAAVLASAEGIRDEGERSVAYLHITQALVTLDLLSDARTAADKCSSGYDRTVAYASIMTRLRRGQEDACWVVRTGEQSPIEKLAGDVFTTFLRICLAAVQQINENDRFGLRDGAYKILAEALVKSHNLGAARVVAEKIQDLGDRVAVETLIIDAIKRG
ncbi:MAG: hypothetical protein WC659_07125 [Patescibacteria group bacterium]